MKRIGVDESMNYLINEIIKVSNFDEEILFYLDTTLTECAHLIYDINKLTIYKKLMLGLPISYLEYAYSNLIDDRLNHDERVNVTKKLQKNINSTKSW